MKRLFTIFIMVVLFHGITIAQGFKVIKTDGTVVTYETKDVDKIEFFDKVKPIYNNHEYVDLGLPSGNLWAKVNMGAEKETDFGDYFAWAEIATKESFDSSNYKYYKSATEMEDGMEVHYEGYTKYVSADYAKDNGYKGFYDNKSVLDIEDDAARSLWGGAWHIPSKSNFDELKKYCRITVGTFEGIKGVKVVGTNGNYIFLPSAGFKQGNWVNNFAESSYMISSIGTAITFDWNSVDPTEEFKTITSTRIFGRSVRPIVNKKDIEGNSENEDPNDDSKGDDVFKPESVTAYYGGGVIMSNGTTLLNGSKLNFFIKNGSFFAIRLTKIQIQEEDKTPGSNLLGESVEIAQGEQKGFTITVGVLGLVNPTCIFTYEYEGNEYTVSTKYQDFSFSKAKEIRLD